MLYGLCSLWLHLNRANEIAVRDHNPSQGCGLIIKRSFLKLHTVKEKGKKKIDVSVRSLARSICQFVQIAYILSLGCLASKLKCACVFCNAYLSVLL